jgi:hypothetical protein
VNSNLWVQVKQIVETFINRSELMPVDENAEQHRARRKEESDIVEADKAGEGGLFKGCFNHRVKATAIPDVADGVVRCPECHWEYEGGPVCEHCGINIVDPDAESTPDFSELGEMMDGPELWDLELDGDLNAEDFTDEDNDMAGEMFRYVLGPNGGPRRIIRPHSISSDSSTSEDDDEDEDEDSGSLRDFIEQDEEEYITGRTRRRASSASRESIGSSVAEHEVDEDEESDEGGSISNRTRRVRPRWASGRTIVTDSSEDESDAHGMEYTQNSHISPVAYNWSPIDHGTDDEDEPINQDSDTETLGREHNYGSEDERFREDGSVTPRYGTSDQFPRSDASAVTDSSDEESHFDSEGDIEMRHTPMAIPVSDDDSEEDDSDRTTTSTRINTHVVTDLTGDDDSSDSSIRPPNRRRRINSTYDPYVRHLFAQYQADVRAAMPRITSSNGGWNTTTRRATPTSRPRVTHYRILPPRPFEASTAPRRISQSPSDSGLPAELSRRNLSLGANRLYRAHYDFI